MRGDVSAGIWLLLPIGAGIGWVGKWIIDRFPDAVDPASETEDPDTVLGPNADSAPPTVDKDMVIELPASNPSAATSPQVIYTTEPSLFDRAQIIASTFLKSFFALACLGVILLFLYAAVIMLVRSVSGE